MYQVVESRESCCCFSRDEDFNLAAKLNKFLKHESHDFLGQKIIEVRMLGGVSDIWYNLGRFGLQIYCLMDNGDGDGGGGVYELHDENDCVFEIDFVSIIIVNI